MSETRQQHWCERCGGVILPLSDATMVDGKPYHPTQLCDPSAAPRRDDATEPKTIDLMKALTDSLKSPRREDAAGEERIQRFYPTVDRDAPFMARSGDGEYVRYADHAAALSTAERERDELHQQLGSAIDVARETMTEITTGRLASIGGIENTYCPQISVSRIKKLHERLVALADSYRARVPSGGEEGR